MPSNMPLPGEQRLVRGPGLGAQPLASPMVLRAGRLIVLFCGAWVALAVFMSTGFFRLPSTSSFRLSQGAGPPRRPSCDPFSVPGYVYDMPGSGGGAVSGPLAQWATFDACRPVGGSGLWARLLSRYEHSPYHSALSSSQGKAGIDMIDRALAGGEAALNRTTKHRTVLLVGDHTDRALVNQICSMAGQRSQSVTGFHPWAKGIGVNPSKRRSLADKRSRPPPKGSFHTTHHLADYCHLPVDDLLLVSVYHFGTAPGDAFSPWNQGGVVWGPADFESRVEKLYRPLLGAMADSGIYSGVLPPVRRSASPDLIVFQSGLWDLALRAQKEVQAQAYTNKAGDESFLLDYRARGSDMLHALSLAFPDSTLAWRSVPHIPDGPEATLGRLIRTTHADLGGDQPGAPILKEMDEAYVQTPLRVVRAAALNSAVKSAFSSSFRGSKDRSREGVPKGTLFLPWADMVRAHTDLLADPLILAAYPSASLFAELLLQTLYYI